jgi:hypothetical protein
MGLKSPIPRLLEHREEMLILRIPPDRLVIHPEIAGYEGFPIGPQQGQQVMPLTTFWCFPLQ